MIMEFKYNMKSPAVKRLMREAKELSEPSVEYYAQPVEDNLFEWHFTVRGPPDSDFDGGIYHGRIILPPEYPMKPPSIILLTPNGRFEVNKKICLSISGHHPESWQPSWSIRTALLAMIGFMPTQGLGAIGSLDYTPDERRALAQRSHDWRCPVCGPINNSLLNPQNTPRQVNEEARDLASRISFKGEGERAENPQNVYVNDTSSLQPSGQGNENTESADNETEIPVIIHDRLNAVEDINAFRSDDRLHHRRPQQQTPNNEVTYEHNVTVTSSSFNFNGSTIVVVVLVIAIIGLLLRRILVL